MRAWKCDRCGKLYLADGSDPTYPNLEDIEIHNIAFGTESYSLSDAYRRKDICKDCAKDFVLWYKTPALASITNEEKL